MPEHLVDLYKRSSEAEKEELKALLIEYADVFSAHDLDLGCFSATPHRINFEKEETSPIRQRMRRVPKGFEEEDEKHLKCKEDHDSNSAQIILPNKRGEEQQKDPELKVIYGWIQERKRKKGTDHRRVGSLSPTVKALWTNRSLLAISDDILWYTWKEGEDKKLLVVAEHLKKSVLKLAHDNIVSGHLGIAKTKERIERHFFWPSLPADVEDYVKACAISNRSKRLRRKYKAPMRSFTAGAPMKKCHLDILGPLPKTASGN